MKKILIVSCTKDISKKEETVLYSSYDGYLEDIADIEFVNGNNGLPVAYNKFIDNTELQDVYDFVCFVHDDVYIDDLKIRHKIYESNYDITGVAGGSELTLKQPCLWHIICSRDSHSGAVAHPTTWGLHVTAFGPFPKRCLVLDGLFLCVNLKRANEAGWRFNENYTFHHYDLSSCIDANNKKLKLGTSDIHLVHMSPGLRDINDKVFAKSDEIFYNEYKS